MKHIIRSFVLIITIALAASAFAHDKHDKKAHAKEQAQTAKAEKGKFLGKGDGVTTCPVTGEEIHNKDVKDEFFNRTVYFCCAGCMAKAKKDPAAYIKKTHAEQVAATKDLPKNEDHHGDHHATDSKSDAKQDSKGDETKFLGKGDGIETCPVTGEAVNKDLKGEVDGQTFYVCCAGCIDTIKQNPAAYLKKK